MTSLSEQLKLSRMPTSAQDDFAQTAPAAETVSGYKAQQNYAQQVRVMNGKAFYQNGNTWTDTASQSKKNLRRQEIKFNSDDYFALAKDRPEVAQWLSLGEEVDLVIGETLYVIR